VNPINKIAILDIEMARLSSVGESVHPRDLPDKVKMQKALEWLHENPAEKPTTAARLHFITNEQSVQQAWRREKKRRERTNNHKIKSGGQNRILSVAQHQALIKYAVDQATNGGMGATKQMMYNCIVFFRFKEDKPFPTWRWFQNWLKNTPELHKIKTKPIARQRVDMHTEQDLFDWFENEYRPALEHTGVSSGKYIHNMDEKGARIGCPTGEEVVVPISIKEMYTGVPENRKSLTVIESVSADGQAIPPVVIVPGWKYMESWFHENMTGHEVLTLSLSGYTNEGICMIWLDHFIKHNDCEPDKPWRILLIDGAKCHEAPEFVLKAKMYKIWVVKFPSHQTHLIQPLDVGCFRQWKHWQQTALMNAIRSFEPEYNLTSFFRDLSEIRARTFKDSTIKHAFRDAGMWPVSFKAVKAKLKEYGKKTKEDIKPNSEKEYELPQLKPPSSYTECQEALQGLENKIYNALSSPTRTRYKIAMDSTNAYLSRGSLHELEVTQARAGAIATHKRRLNTRKSLGKGGSLLAADALETIKTKRRNEANDKIKKAKRAVEFAENQAKRQLHIRGVQARKDEKARIAHLRSLSIGIPAPNELWTPIRDPEKNPTSAEKEALRAHPSLYDAVAIAEAEYEASRSENPADFTSIPIDPSILEDEHRFAQRQGRVTNQVVIQVEEEELGEPGEGSGDEGSEAEGSVSSVASLDSIAQNADFIHF
jgi:hypothetical protein